MEPDAEERGASDCLLADWQKERAECRPIHTVTLDISLRAKYTMSYDYQCEFPACWCEWLPEVRISHQLHKWHLRARSVDVSKEQRVESRRTRKAEVGNDPSKNCIVEVEMGSLGCVLSRTYVSST